MEREASPSIVNLASMTILVQRIWSVWRMAWLCYVSLTFLFIVKNSCILNRVWEQERHPRVSVLSEITLDNVAQMLMAVTQAAERVVTCRQLRR